MYSVAIIQIYYLVKTIPISGMELGLENRGWESESEINLPRGNVPEEHIPVGGGGEEFVATPVPAKRRDWVDMPAAESSDPTRHEIPDGDAAIVATDGEEGAPPVKGASESLTA